MMLLHIYWIFVTSQHIYLDLNDITMDILDLNNANVHIINILDPNEVSVHIY